MSWYNSSMTDYEYHEMEEFQCPYHFKCETCEYDCEEDFKFKKN